MRVVGGDELTAWRRRLPKGWQRAVSKPLRTPKPPGDRVGEDAGSFSLDVQKPVPPADVHAQVLDRLRRGAFRSREDLQAAVAQLRKWSPTLIAHLTDAQAAQMLEEQWNRQIQEAVSRVYRRTGRAHELTIRIP